MIEEGVLTGRPASDGARPLVAAAANPAVAASSPVRAVGNASARAARRRWQAALRAARPNVRDDAAFETLFRLLDDSNCYRGIADAAALEQGLGAYHAAYLRHAAIRLREAIAFAEAHGLAVAPGIAPTILAAFAKRLREAGSATAALLMNVSRIMGELAGETPEERAGDFARLLLQADYRQGCRRKFPALDEILFAMTEDAERAWLEFFERLVADRDSLGEILPAGLGTIEQLIFYAGDPHNGGRSVVILHGSGGSLVYKPRSLDTDWVLGRAITWLESHLALGLAHFPIVRRGDYGWTAFIRQRDAAGPDEVDLCYERCGALIGLIFLLGGGDIHHENVICQGALPYVVDAEALLNGPLKAPSLAARRIQRARLETVINTWYLPALLQVGETFVDLSGAGYRAGQPLEFKSVVPNGRDDAGVETIHYSSNPSGNAPTLAGVAQPASEHIDSIVRGFRAAFEAMIAHRDEFLTRPDLMPAFATATFRFIPRATAYYGRRLREALHPHGCRDSEAHDEGLSVLAAQTSWCERPTRGILAAEVSAMRRGDIPFFKGVAGEKSIWASDGAEIPNMFQISGHRSAVARIRRLDRRYMESQIAAIRLAFSAAAFEIGKGAQRANARAPAPARDDAAPQVAREIADLLIDRAIVVDGHVSWVGRHMIDNRYSPVLVGMDLYGGVAGIGIFLAEVASRFPEQRYRDIATACLGTIRASEHLRMSGIGAFEGMAGCVYADLLMSRALGVAPAETLGARLGEIADRVEHDQMFDLISGAAGALLVALRARRHAELVAPAERAAKACAAHLLANAVPAEGALAWKAPAFEVPLNGLAHGSCGIGLALAEHAAAFGDAAARAAALQAFDHARAAFDPQQQLWRDLRHEEGCMVAWCHGAAGIALARQRAIELLPRPHRPALRADIEKGLAGIVRCDRPGSDTMCHGRSGNWEALWRGGPQHREIARREVARFCLDWQAGVVPGGDLTEPTLDLMNGLAGIGLQLLRSADRSVPAVTILAD